MDYYSRSPEEIRARMEEEDRREKAITARSRRLVLMSFILVAGVFAILNVLQRTTEASAKNQKVARTFEWENLQIATACIDNTCSLTTVENDKGDKSQSFMLKWEQFDQDEVVQESISLLAPQNSYRFTLHPIENSKVYISILGENSQTLFRMRVYP